MGVVDPVRITGPDFDHFLVYFPRELPIRVGRHRGGSGAQSRDESASHLGTSRTKSCADCSMPRRFRRHASAWRGLLVTMASTSGRCEKLARERRVVHCPDEQRLSDLLGLIHEPIMSHQKIDISAQACSANVDVPAREDQASSNAGMDRASLASTARRNDVMQKSSRRKIPKQQRRWRRARSQAP